MKKDKILKVLEKTPSSTKLYSTTFGKLEFNGIVASVDGLKIELATKNQECITYFPDGRYRKDGEVTLYPSKEMRDWGKFAWKKGDVLVSQNGNTHVIFEKFTNDTYTIFTGRHYCYNDGENKDAARACCNIVTNHYALEKESAAQAYINDLEKRFEGKLNLETLEVEKIKFKDGDILCGEKDTMHTSVIFILKTDKEKIRYYACLPLDSSMMCYYDCASFIGNKTFRYAKAEEIAKLFNALAKEGKRWNIEKKIIEDIKPKPKKESATYKKKNDPPEHEFEPFEKVLVRDQKTDKWTVGLYGFKNEEDYYNYQCVGGNYVYCIPYEGNEHLLGTTNNPEG